MYQKHIFMHYKILINSSEIYNLGLSDANLSKLELCEKIKLYVKDLNIFQSEYGKDPDKRNYVVSNEKIEKKDIKRQFLLSRE